MTFFLHSFWRSSSTYIAAKFRAPEHNTYWYYEPYNEMLNRISKETAQIFDHTNWDSRHPPLKKAYFHEYIPLIKPDGGVEGYQKSFAYGEYFPNGVLLPDAEKKYLLNLQTHAVNQGEIPTFAFCRSLGRVGHLRGFMEGIHLVHYRNPHGVLASFYKRGDYFRIKLYEIIKLIRKKSLPDLLNHHTPNIEATLKTSWPQISDDSLYSAYSHEFTTLFFDFYVFSNVAAIFYSDIFFDVDRMASDKNYRIEIEKNIAEATGLQISFDDIQLPKPEHPPVYDPRFLEYAIDKYIGDEKKISKFKEILEKISGVPVVQSIDTIKTLRDSFRSNYPSSDNKEHLLHALDYANEELGALALQAQRLKNKINEQKAKLVERDARLAERDARLAESKAILENILNSTSWKITKPLRKIKALLKNSIIRNT